MPLRKLTLIIIPACTLVFSGCATLIGLGVGYSSDRSAPSEIRIASAMGLQLGTPITAVMIDSTHRSGLYDGYCSLWPTGAVDSAASADDDVLPYYGEPVEISDTLGVTREYMFWSYFFRKHGQDWIPCVNLTGPGDSTVQFDLARIRELRRCDGAVVDREWLMAEFAGGHMPPSSGIVIRDSASAQAIPLVWIDHLEAPVKKHGAIRGLMIGLTMDLIFWVSTTVIALHNWPED